VLLPSKNSKKSPFLPVRWSYNIRNPDRLPSAGATSQTIMERHDSMSELNSTRLQELLGYDSKTGIFTWQMSRGRAKKGSLAGSLTNEGYIKIRIDGQMYFAHKLAWLFTHGEMPAGDIDHINGARKDNRIENLRSVSRSVNLQNMRKPKGENPYLGVTWDKKNNKWRAQITVNYKHKNLGRFDTAEKAQSAYLTEKRKLHKGCTI
jgi:hypothetical protein